jgi:hypothetical protein
MALITNLQHIWHFDETSGSTISDSYGSLDGTLSGATLDTGGISNGCILSNAGGECVNYGNNNDIERDDPWTFSLWYKSLGGNGNLLFGKYNFNIPVIGYFFTAGANGIGIVMRNSTYSEVIYKYKSAVYDFTTKFNHLVITNSGAGNAAGINFYVNGVLVTGTTTDYDTLTHTIVNTSDFKIGGWYTTHTANGRIDEFFQWDRELTSTEVTYLYNSGYGLFELDLPSVITSSATTITHNSAIGGGNVTYSGTTAINTRGLCWSTSSGATTGDTHIDVTGTTGIFTASMTSLSANTLYYFRAFAANSSGVTYGNELTFTTDYAPVYATVSATDVSCNGGSNGTITFDNQSGGTGVYQYSINNKANWYSTSGFTGLTAGSYNCWIRQSGNTGNTYNSNASLAVSEPDAMYFTIDKTDSCKNRFNGTITFENQSGGTSPYEYKISGSTYYSNPIFTGLTATTYYPMMKDANDCILTGTSVTVSQPANYMSATLTRVDVSTVGASDGSITFSSPTGGWGAPYEYSITTGASAWQSSGVFTGLTAGNYRLDMKDSGGCIESFILEYPIYVAIPPQVITSGVTHLTMKSLSSGGQIVGAYFPFDPTLGPPATDRGLCWSTSSGATTGDTHTHNGSGYGSFSQIASGLTQNTTYYFRAFGVNQYGITYGNEVQHEIVFVPPVLSGSVITNYVHLTWTDVNPEAEHYEVWRLVGNGFPKTQLRSYWTLNELGGPGNYVDATGNYQDLSATYGGSGMSDANGKINGCWYNTGLTSMAYGGINLGSWSRTPIVGYYYNSLSVNAWIKRNGSGYTEVIMSTQDYQRATNTYNGWMLYIDSSNHLVFQIRNDADVAHPSWMTSTSTAKLQPNVWYMVTGTYDGMNNTYGNWLKTYINGSEDSNYNQTVPFVTRDWDANSRYVLIGSSMSTTGKQFRGYIDEVSIFAPIGYVYYPDPAHQSQQLTPTEIDTLYNYGNGIEYELCGTGTTKTLLATVDAPDQYYDDYIAASGCTYTYCVKALLDSYTPDLVTACSNDITVNGNVIGIYAPSGLTGILVAGCAIEFNWINNSLYDAIILQNYGSWNTIATIAGGLETYTWNGTPTSNIFRVIGVVNGVQYISDQAICEVPPAVDSTIVKNSRCFGLNPSPGRIIVDFEYLISGHTYTFNVYNIDNTLYYSQSGMSYSSTFFVDNVKPDCYYVELLDETCDCTVQTTIYCVESTSPFNLSGVKRVFVSEYKDDLDWNNWSTGDENYFINGYDLLKFQSVKIKEFLNANTWYSIPTAEDSNYNQKMQKVRQGFVFNDVLSLSFTPSSYAKWLATGTLLEKRWVVVFEDNNSTPDKPQWWVFGYQNEGAKIRMYNRKSDFNNYTLEFSANTGDKIITALDYDNYVLPSIINS